MDVNRIISELDAEIGRLQQIRAALGGMAETEASPSPPKSAPAKGRRGRPKGSRNLPKAASEILAAKTVAKKAPAKRKLTPEGRKRIADAMTRRWAAHRKASSK